MRMQKALHLHIELDKKKPKLGEYHIFEKYDGWYGYIGFNDNNYSSVFSSRDRAIPSCAHLRDVFRQKVNTDGLRGRFIFEILSHSVTDFHILNGLINRSKGDCALKDAYVRVHDMLIYSEMQRPFESRYERLLERAPVQDDTIKTAPVLGRHDRQGVWEHICKGVWEKGGEGVILKRSNDVYQPGKRNSSLLKIKEEVTLDLEVVSVVEGEGKYYQTLGCLIVRDSKGRTHSISGMTDAERDAWWKSPDLIVGQVVEVKAMKRLPDGSLREPRFKAIRFDKRKGDID